MKDTFDIGKGFAHAAADLTDSEITQVFSIIESARARYAGRHNLKGNLEELRDEVLTKLMEINVLATFDPAPCFYDEPPVVEILGKTDPVFKDHGLDHEKKQFEVRKSVERGEDWLGQKESVNKQKDKGKKSV